MPIITVSVTSPLDPAAAVRRLTDFSPARTEAWANVDANAFTLHSQGDGWAEVTEGNKLGWERERYTWDVAAGRVTAETLKSNLWQPGPAWDYRITPEGTGSRVEVTARRIGHGVKGKLVQGLLALAGKKLIAKGTADALKA